MREGDMVRFRDIINHRTEELTDWKYGIIAEEYIPWMKIVTIMHEGELRRIRANYVQIHQAGHIRDRKKRK
jgi:hypothetical protein